MSNLFEHLDEDLIHKHEALILDIDQRIAKLELLKTHTQSVLKRLKKSLRK